MRADAVANREKLLDAASDLFAESGIETPMHLIADRADVGVGTLYRHFEDRDAVIIALCERLMVALRAFEAEAAEAPTGWDALMTYIDGATKVYLDNPWAAPAIARFRRLVPADQAVESNVLAHVQRAREEGSLREDVSALDLTFIAPMLGSLVTLPEPARAMVLPRLRSLLLDAIRPEGDPRPPIGGDDVAVQDFRREVGRPDA